MLCPKNEDGRIIRCVNCLFLQVIHTSWGQTIHECKIMDTDVGPDGNLPRGRTSKECPLLEAKRKKL